MLPTNSRPLTLTVSSEKFASIWMSCILDKTSDMTKLLEVVHPFISKWERLLTDKEETKDINYVALCRMLSPTNPEEAREKISTWLESVQTPSSIYDELIYLFIERVRRIKYKPKLAKPLAVEYIVASDFRMGLNHLIRGACRRIKRDAFTKADSYEKIEIPVLVEPADYLLIENLDLDRWESYLLHLLKQGFSSVERSQLTHFHRRSLHTQEQNLWHLLKQKL